MQANESSCTVPELLPSRERSVCRHDGACPCTALWLLRILEVRRVKGARRGPQRVESPRLLSGWGAKQEVRSGNAIRGSHPRNLHPGRVQMRAVTHDTVSRAPSLDHGPTVTTSGPPPTPQLRVSNLLSEHPVFSQAGMAACSAPARRLSGPPAAGHHQRARCAGNAGGWPARGGPTAPLARALRFVSPATRAPPPAPSPAPVPPPAPHDRPWSLTMRCGGR